MQLAVMQLDVHIPTPSQNKNSPPMMAIINIETNIDHEDFFAHVCALMGVERCGCATYGSSHLRPSSHIPYIDRDSHLSLTLLPSSIHCPYPLETLGTLPVGDQSAFARLHGALAASTPST